MNKKFCVKLKEVRLEKKITQKQLAKLMLCSVYKIRRLEKCLISAQEKDLIFLKYILQVEIKYLLGEDVSNKYIVDGYFADTDVLFKNKLPTYVIFE